MPGGLYRVALAAQLSVYVLGLVGLATTLGTVGADGVKANGSRVPTSPSTGATIPGSEPARARAESGGKG